MHAQTRDEQIERAVSTENVDEEGKHALTGDEEDLERLTSWRCGGRKNNKFPSWEIRNSTSSHDVRVLTDFNELQTFDTSTSTPSPEPLLCVSPVFCWQPLIVI